MKIGLEIHMYPDTRAKMFCTCSTDFLNAEPNTNICPICTAQPGSKPMALNKKAIDIGIQIALFLNCEIITDTPIYTQRKHYFYPDLPSNYQRTSQPFAVRGKLNGVGITEIHWEEDPGQYELRTGDVDYNRSGMPLMEIVTDPDMKTPAEAREFLNDLRLILDYATLGRPDLSFKIDTNVSTDGGERAEVKNINSIRGVEAAAEYEGRRQKEARANGEIIKRETRHFDERFNMTVPLREKESAEDYRYFPDPDLHATRITETWLADVRQRMVENPVIVRDELMGRYAIGKEMANNLLSERALFLAFGAVAEHCDAKLALDWFLRDVKRELNYRSKTYADARLSQDTMVELLTLLQDGKITMMVAKTLLRTWLDGGDITPNLTEARASDSSTVGGDALDATIRDIIAKHPQAVEDFAKGKSAAINVIVGMTMKALQGKGDPKQIRAIAETMLKKE